MRLIGASGEQVGIVSIEEARQAALEAKLDLVEIAPDADPVVCKVLDYGKMVFEAKRQSGCQEKAATHAGQRDEVPTRNG